MVVELVHGVRWLDLMIHRKLGIAYNAVLGIGLVVEIVRHLHEAHELQGTNMVQTVLAVALFAFLLLHQLAELAEHVDRRFRMSRLFFRRRRSPAEGRAPVDVETAAPLLPPAPPGTIH